MKRLLLLLTFVMAFSMSWGQTAGDRAAILQKTIDLADLQQYYPLNADGTSQEIYIMQHEVSFPFDIEVSKFGKKPVFLGKDAVYNGNIKGFFLFEKFEITSSQAEVSLLYNLKAPQGYRAVAADLTLQKANGDWNITDKKVEWR